MGKVLDGGEDDDTTLPEDPGDGPRSVKVLERGEDTTLPEDPGDGPRSVQLLSIRANFHVNSIYALDWRMHKCIYCAPEGYVQEEGMVDLVPIGPYGILEGYGALGFRVYPEDDIHNVIKESWWVTLEDDEVEEQTQMIDGGLGRKLEITYLVMPIGIETHVKVRLNLKDLGSGSRAVYGSIKASSIDYGSKSVHLFSCDRERSLSFPCGSTCILPLSPFRIALPKRRHFKLHIVVDLRVVTTCHSQEEDKSLKFCVDFSHRVTSQEREVDGDQVEVNIWVPSW